VLEDAVLTFPLLKRGAILVFDDYGLAHADPLATPRPAVDAFLAVQGAACEVLHRNYQLILRKSLQAGG
jgi:hypothetical protein